MEYMGEDLELINSISRSKIYTCHQLNAMPLKTVFEHSVLGRCIIMLDVNTGWKYMHFRNPRIARCYFINDEAPWDEPMLMLGD
jgi:hypothetical protein